MAVRQEPRPRRSQRRGAPGRAPSSPGHGPALARYLLLPRYVRAGVAVALLLLLLVGCIAGGCALWRAAAGGATGAPGSVEQSPEVTKTEESELATDAQRVALAFYDDLIAKRTSIAAERTSGTARAGLAAWVARVRKDKVVGFSILTATAAGVTCTVRGYEHSKGRYRGVTLTLTPGSADGGTLGLLVSGLQADPKTSSKPPAR